jgi:hypothetical protein
MAVTDSSLPVATYLAGLPDVAWSDLESLAGDLLGRFRAVSGAELERGIAISLEIARARMSETKSPRQERIAAALAEAGVAGAAALVASDWAGHSGPFRAASR